MSRGQSTQAFNTASERERDRLRQRAVGVWFDRKCHRQLQQPTGKVCLRQPLYQGRRIRPDHQHRPGQCIRCGRELARRARCNRRHGARAKTALPMRRPRQRQRSRTRAIYPATWPRHSKSASQPKPDITRRRWALLPSRSAPISRSTARRRMRRIASWGMRPRRPRRPAFGMRWATVSPAISAGLQESYSYGG